MCAARQYNAGVWNTRVGTHCDSFTQRISLRTQSISLRTQRISLHARACHRRLATAPRRIQLREVQLPVGGLQRRLQSKAIPKTANTETITQPIRLQAQIKALARVLGLGCRPAA